MISAPFVVVYDQKNITDHDRSHKNTSSGPFPSQFISLDEENVNGVPFSLAIISVNAAGSKFVLFGQEEKASRVSSEIHVDRLENEVNAPNPANDMVPNGSDLLSISPGANHPTGAFSFSLLTTVDTSNEVENRQMFPGLHVRQLSVGNEVNSMYNEDQFATPDNGINSPIDTPVSRAEVCIDLYYPLPTILLHCCDILTQCVCYTNLFHVYFNKGSDNRMLTIASTRSPSFGELRLATRGMRRTPIVKPFFKLSCSYDMLTRSNVSGRICL